ncbi:MAG TPA: alkaline phosphatase family protein [Candidatus Angelobacter sp.]|nr:alkaline phosphatase family protein [Candidatus Angelobacter sp.]
MVVPTRLTTSTIFPIFSRLRLPGNLPAVSFLKAKKAEDGHAGYSSPLDEQLFLVNTINFLQSLSEWNETLVIIAYDATRRVALGAVFFSMKCNAIPDTAHPSHLRRQAGRQAGRQASVYSACSE